MIWGWLGTGLSVFGLVANIILLATYTQEVKTHIAIEEVGVFDKYYEAGVIEAQTGYCIMIAVCVLGIGTSYMVILAVKNVSFPIFIIFVYSLKLRKCNLLSINIILNTYPLIIIINYDKLRRDRYNKHSNAMIVLLHTQTGLISN